MDFSIRIVGGETPVVSPTKAPNFLAKGGFGCVVQPAIVLPNSVVIHEANKFEYVTKLGRNIQNGYTLAKAIEKEAPDAGVYPIDPIATNISYDLLGPNASEIVSQCKGLFPEEQATLDTTKVYAVQQPKFFQDLSDFRAKYKQQIFQEHVTFGKLCFEQLSNRLQELHTHDIVHLDIKARNIAVFYNPGQTLKTVQLKQNDFDLAAKLSKANALDIVWNLNMDYYREIMSNHIQYEEEKDSLLTKSELTSFWVKQDLIHKLATHESFREEQVPFFVQFLKSIDICCLINALQRILFLWQPDQSELKQIMKKTYLQFQNSYTTEDIEALFRPCAPKFVRVLLRKLVSIEFEFWTLENDVLVQRQEQINFVWTPSSKESIEIADFVSNHLQEEYGNHKLLETWFSNTMAQQKNSFGFVKDKESQNRAKEQRDKAIQTVDNSRNLSDQMTQFVKDAKSKIETIYKFGPQGFILSVEPISVKDLLEMAYDEIRFDDHLQQIRNSERIVPAQYKFSCEQWKTLFKNWAVQGMTSIPKEELPLEVQNKIVD